MKSILARCGIEFMAVVLGVTISLWIDETMNKSSKRREQISLRENLQTSLDQDLNYALKIKNALDTCLTSQRYLMNLNC